LNVLLYTAALEEEEHISAGHSKTNRNAAITFDFALQSVGQEENEISVSLPLLLLQLRHRSCLIVVIGRQVI
jgi:hypothetical protein